MLNCDKILIVDDDKDDQSFLLDILQELYPDLKCEIANNGEEALSYIHADPPPPKIIFLDLNMPVLNGFEFLRDYKNTLSSNESNIIIYSTSSHPKDKEITSQLGASDYLTKISDYSKLKTKVQVLVEKYC
jgi:CheY-like chemotaxis protein